jgi:hypothetical protein
MLSKCKGSVNSAFLSPKLWVEISHLNQLIEVFLTQLGKRTGKIGQEKL